MDLKDYLSMACLLVQRNRADSFLTFFNLLFFLFFFSLDGKNEFIQTDAHSTLTTVRQFYLTSVYLVQ